jgi:hypothetical protein
VADISDHPSMRTKSINLKGREIIIGDSIIIPIDIKTAATTRSMTRNGTNNKNPIWKAVFSSLVKNDGSKTNSGTSSL